MTHGGSLCPPHLSTHDLADIRCVHVRFVGPLFPPWRRGQEVQLWLGWRSTLVTQWSLQVSGVRFTP
jgi:hypothetical protein